METPDGEFLISDDRARLDVAMIHRFLSEQSYWAATRTLEQTRTAIDNSLCFGVYHGPRQVGFARVVSDFATFAYVGDVFIIGEYRGRGLSKLLMETIAAHASLQNLRRWLLATRDAHRLYERFGFSSLRFPEGWMERTAPDAY